MDGTGFLTRISINPVTSGYVVKIGHSWPTKLDEDNDTPMSCWPTKQEEYGCNTAEDALAIVTQYLKEDGMAQEEYFADAIDDAPVKRRKRRKRRRKSKKSE